MDDSSAIAGLSVEFEDPLAATTITIPDESGIVLTTTSSFSTLQGVGNLNNGQIGVGFGSIVTEGDIETVGVDSQITAAGTTTANSNFVANGPVSSAVGETGFLVHPHLPLVGVSIGMEREPQQNDSLANG